MHACLRTCTSGDMQITPVVIMGTGYLIRWIAGTDAAGAERGPALAYPQPFPVAQGAPCHFACNTGPATGAGFRNCGNRHLSHKRCSGGAQAPSTRCGAEPGWPFQGGSYWAVGARHIGRPAGEPAGLHTTTVTHGPPPHVAESKPYAGGWHFTTCTQCTLLCM